MTRLREHGNETSGSVKGGKFVDYLRCCMLYKIKMCCTKILAPFT
jgi:hypothetical protein